MLHNCYYLFINTPMFGTPVLRFHWNYFLIFVCSSWLARSYHLPCKQATIMQNRLTKCVNGPITARLCRLSYNQLLANSFHHRQLQAICCVRIHQTEIVSRCGHYRFFSSAILTSAFEIFFYSNLFSVINFSFFVYQCSGSILLISFNW